MIRSRHAGSRAFGRRLGVAAVAAGLLVALVAIVHSVVGPGAGPPSTTATVARVEAGNRSADGRWPPQLHAPAAPRPGSQASDASNAPNSRSEPALRQGIGALQRGQQAAAALSFERAVSLDPRSALARDYLGVAYLQQRRFAPALRQFREEIRLSSDPAIGWARVADVYHAQGSDKEAMQALEQARALRPDLAQLHFNAGMLYLSAAEPGKAVSALDRCVALDPRNHYAQYLRGNTLFKLARLDEAEQALADAIRVAPSVGLYHYGLAQVHLRRTAPAAAARARGELEQALALGVPEPAAARYHLGLCHQRQGNWEAARRELETSVRMAPEAWSAWYALQEVLAHLGRVEEARRARERFHLLRQQEDARMQRSFYVQEAQRNPESADAQYQLAEFLARAGEMAAARRALGSAQQLARRKETRPELRRRVAVLAAELRR